jgi:Na+/proline symporter
MDKFVRLLAGTVMTIFGFMLLGGILLGNGKRLPFDINNVQDVRTICLAVWSFVLPAWSTVEESIWCPPVGTPEELSFRKTQQGARACWTMGAAVVCLVVGSTPTKPLDPIPTKISQAVASASVGQSAPAM